MTDLVLKKTISCSGYGKDQFDYNDIEKLSFIALDIVEEMIGYSLGVVL